MKPYCYRTVPPVDSCRIPEISPCSDDGVLSMGGAHSLSLRSVLCLDPQEGYNSEATVKHESCSHRFFLSSHS